MNPFIKIMARPSLQSKSLPSSCSPTSKNRSHNQKTLVGFFFGSAVVPHTDAKHHLSCSPWDLRPRSYHGLMWNHPREQADARVTLPYVRHLLNYHPGMISNRPAPSPLGFICSSWMAHQPMLCTANGFFANHSSCSTGTCGLPSAK